MSTTVPITGLNAAQAQLNVIGDNIANSNTVGFKSSSINFSDIYGGSNGSVATPGLGVRYSSIQQDFTSGPVELTGSALDLSIANDGFFVQRDPVGGTTSFTRSGHFQLDSTGYLLTSEGARLQGFIANKGAITNTGTTGDLLLSQDLLAANATTKLSLSLNLDASSTPPSGTFNPADSTTYNYVSQQNVFDSLGQSYPISVYFLNTAPDTWTAQVSVNGTLIDDGSGISPVLSFNNTGELTSTSHLTGLSFSPTNGSAFPQLLGLDLTGTTQYANSNQVISSAQDGYTSGEVSDFVIDSSGNITLNYDNGQSILQGQLAIAIVPSLTGLTRSSNMSWTANALSGTPTINQNNSNNAINVGTLEQSNVDLTSSLVDLVVAQQYFNANVQSMQVNNQIIEEVETKL